MNASPDLRQIEAQLSCKLPRGSDPHDRGCCSDAAEVDCVGWAVEPSRTPAFELFATARIPRVLDANPIFDC